MGEVERRPYVAIELKGKRLGLYLEPGDDDNRGAVLRRFEPILDDATGQTIKGEAEAAGTVRAGFLLTGINDTTVRWSQFPTIITMLVNLPRPVRLTFRDPTVPEYRDRYGFIRSKLHVTREAALVECNQEANKKNDYAWLEYLTELGKGIAAVTPPPASSSSSSSSSAATSAAGAGAAAVSRPVPMPMPLRGPMAGLQRLLRDCRGELSFTCAPGARLHAPHSHGSSNSSTSSGNSNSATANAAGGAAAAASVRAAPGTPGRSSATGAGAGAGSVPSTPARNININSSSGATGSGVSGLSSQPVTPARSGLIRRERASSESELPEERERSREQKALATQASAVVISIYKRCWGSSSIGVAVPPGLSIDLPGPLPKAKAAAKLHAQLQQLVLHGGIPAAYRPGVWFELSGAKAKAALHPPLYYESLASLKPSAEAAMAIQKDLDRTFPGHPYFESKAGLSSLHRLLSAFAVHNPDIGYCQSLNFVAGFLLLLLPEDHAFWVLETIVNELLPPDYYCNALLGVHADQRVLAHLIEEMMPEVAEAFSRAGIQLHLVTVEWFMCAMCTVLPAYTSLRVWDALFLRGSEVLFRVALSLFYINRDRIISVAASSTSSQVTVKQHATPGPHGHGHGHGHSSSGSAGGGHGQGHGRPGSVLASSPPAQPAVVVATTQPAKKGLLSGGIGSALGLVRGRDTVAETANRVMAAASLVGISSANVGGAQGPPPVIAVAQHVQGKGKGDGSGAAGAGRGDTDSADGCEGDGESSTPSLRTPSSLPSPSTPGPSASSSSSSSAAAAFQPVSPAALARGGTIRSPASTFPALFSMLKGMPGACHDAEELMRVAFPLTPKDIKASLPWDTCLSPARLQRLRGLARAVAVKEHEEAMGMRAAAGLGPTFGSSSSSSNNGSGNGARSPAPTTPAPASRASSTAAAVVSTPAPADGGSGAAASATGTGIEGEGEEIEMASLPLPVGLGSGLGGLCLEGEGAEADGEGVGLPPAGGDDDEDEDDSEDEEDEEALDRTI